MKITYVNDSVNLHCDIMMRNVCESSSYLIKKIAIIPNIKKYTFVNIMRWILTYENILFQYSIEKLIIKKNK